MTRNPMNEVDEQAARAIAARALKIDVDDVALVRLRSGWRAWDHRAVSRIGGMHVLVGVDAHVHFSTADVTDGEAEASLQEGS